MIAAVSLSTASKTPFIAFVHTSYLHNQGVGRIGSSLGKIKLTGQGKTRSVYRGPYFSEGVQIYQPFAIKLVPGGTNFMGVQI